MQCRLLELLPYIHSPGGSGKTWGNLSPTLIGSAYCIVLYCTTYYFNRATIIRSPASFHSLRHIATKDSLLTVLAAKGYIHSFINNYANYSRYVSQFSNQ